MQSLADASTVDLTRTCLRLGDDVSFSPHVYGGDTYYHIQHASTSQFFRIGYPEYVFVSLLDGKTTFSKALALTARSCGADALGQQQALSLYTWLLEQKIAQVAEDSARIDVECGDDRSPVENVRKLNPFWIRIPLGRPELLLQAVSPLVAWLFSPAATVIGFLLIGAAAIQVAKDWIRFSVAASGVFAPDNWIWLLIAWISLKILHELGHAVVCKKYGGDVSETGVILAFFAPLAYVDVTSSWAFSSKWKRIHVASAGMYVELLLAAAAVFAWSRTESLVLSHLFYNVILMASFSTVVFNANPLMKFDGYYIFSDLLNQPNLYTKSSEAIKGLCQRYIWGQQPSLPELRGSKGWILNAYGLSALAWRLLVCSSMLIAASALFHGAGVALAIAGIVAWFGVPAYRFFRSLRMLASRNPMKLLRGGIMIAAMFAFAGCLLFHVPTPFSTVAPGVVELQEGRQVRAEVEGFVREVCVSDGQKVQKGDVLFRLRNDDVMSRIVDLKSQISQQLIRQQTAMNQHNSGDASVAVSNLNSLREKLREAQRRQSLLTITAPTSGTLIARNLHSRLGTFVREGDELLLVDDHCQRRLRISVAQKDIESAEEFLARPVQVRIGTRRVLTGLLEKVIPRASRRLPDDALAATSGGSLAVNAREPTDGDDRKLQLTEHRFEAIVQLGQLVHGELPIGERGYVTLGHQDVSLARHIYNAGSEWLNRQFETARVSQDRRRF